MKQETIKIKTLDLVVKGIWYDMQKSGEKPEEYRDIKPYWTRRICGCKASTNWCRENKNSCEGCQALRNQKPLDYTHLVLRRGYTSQCIMKRIDNITTGRGNPEWGAPTDRDVYIIRHHKEQSPFIIRKDL